MENKEIDVEIPFFVVDEQLQSKANVQDDYAILGDVLMGLCYWSNHTWPTLSTYSGNPKIVALPLIEKYFTWQWFLNEWVTSGPNAVDIDPYTNFGYTKLYRFDWFQYGLDNDEELFALSHGALLNANHALLIPGRSGDVNLCVYDCTPLRKLPPALYSETTETNKITALEDNPILIAPNPAKDYAQITIFKNHATISNIEIIDIKGSKCTGNFILESGSTQRSYTIKNENNLSGLFMVKILLASGETLCKPVTFNFN
ncbi:MAG: hypothetical protein IPO27_03240 [Bacteroidetes bacterium]|nr:hypothetical protein [Bacteroidota bacterium]